MLAGGTALLLRIAAPPLEAEAAGITGTPASGVYALRNVATGKYWGATPWPGCYTALGELSAAPVAGGNRYWMFKIVALSDGTFVIRDMCNTMTILSGDHPAPFTAEGTAADSATPAYHRWTITYGTGGYTITTKSTTYSGKMLAVKSTGDGMEMSATSNNYSKWELLPVIGTIEGVEWAATASSMAVGSGYEFNAFPYSSVIGRNGGITWSVTNGTGTAAVASTGTTGTKGLVTATKSGAVTVKAAIIGATGTYSTWGVTVVRPIEDGVYAFTSKASNINGYPRRMDVWNGSSSSGAQVSQYGNTDPVDAVRRAQLFKVTYLETSGGICYYSIRPMTNSGLGLKYDDTASVKIKIETMSTTDSWAIPWPQCWGIAGNATDGYTVKAGNSGKYLACPTSTGNSAALTLNTTIDNYAKWELKKYTGEAMEGINWIDTANVLEVGNYQIFKASIYSSVIGRNSGVAWSVTNGTGAATMNSLGVLTATGAGTVTVKATITGSTGAYATYGVELRLSEESCFLQNVDKPHRYVDANNSPSSGTPLEIVTLDHLYLAQWQFHYEGDGYYSIKNWRKNLFITDTIGAAVNNEEKASSGFTDFQLWKVFYQSDGTYKFQSKNNAGTSYYLAHDNSNGDPDVNQTNSTSNTDRQKWNVKTIKEGGDVVLIESSYNASWFWDQNSFYRAVPYLYYHYSSFTIMPNAVVSKTDALSLLDNCKIFAGDSHGSYIGLILGPDGGIIIDDIWDFPTNTMVMDLSNIDIAIYAGCNTAAGGEFANNIPRATVLAGGKVAIGFEDEIYDGETNIWVREFFKAMNNDKTTQQACDIATSKTESDWGSLNLFLDLGTHTFVLCGNHNFKFN